MNQNRFPLIINSESGRIEELAAGDNLDLTGSNIANVVDVNVSGNIVTSGIKTDNYMYANGQPFAGGSGNVEYANTAGVAYSVDAANVVGTVANASFATLAATSNVALSVAGANVTGTVANATFATTSGTAQSVAGANVVGAVANATFATNAGSANTAFAAGSAQSAVTAGTVVDAAQPNITSVGTLTGLSVNGATTISGNLTVTGNVTVTGTTQNVNVTTLQVQDPVIQQGAGANGANLTTNDGKDRGQLLHYYTTQPVNAFMGWDNSNAEFAFGSNVSMTNDVVTFTQLGNVRASHFIGNGSQLTGITASNVAGANVVGAVATSNVSLTSNITERSSLTTVNLLGANSASGNLQVQGISQVTYGPATGLQAPTITSNAFVGNGAQLTNLNAANITGTIIAAQANVANVASVANTVSGANVTGTVANATFAVTSNVSNNSNIAQVGGLETVNLLGATSTSGNLQPRGLTGITYTVVNGLNITALGGVTSTSFNGSGSGLTGIPGANVTGTVANATFATSAGSANTANIATVANSVAGANVSGTVANATFATTSGTADIALSVAGANVSGEVANASYATSAGSALIASNANVAFSVAGANVSGEVANASFATNAETANIANIAYSVDAANIVGEVANASFATLAGAANVAYSVDAANVVGEVANAAYALTASNAESVDVSNVTGIGNIATIYLNDDNTTYLDGTGAWASIPAPSTTGLWKVARVSIGYGSSAEELVQLPADALVDRVTVIVDEVWDDVPTVTVGFTGSESEYVSSTDVNLLAVGRYDIPVSVAPNEFQQTVYAYVSADSATQGSARVIITYAEF